MKDNRLIAALANSLTRSKRFMVWFDEHNVLGNVGRFIYLANHHDLYRVEIGDGIVKILDTSDCTYESFELADPVGMERMFQKFEIDETTEPKPFTAIEALDSLMGKR